MKTLSDFKNPIVSEEAPTSPEVSSTDKATAAYALLTIAQGLMSEIGVKPEDGTILQKLKRLLQNDFGADRTTAIRDGTKIVKKVRGLGIMEDEEEETGFEPLSPLEKNQSATVAYAMLQIGQDIATSMAVPKSDIEKSQQLQMVLRSKYSASVGDALKLKGKITASLIKKKILPSNPFERAS